MSAVCSRCFELEDKQTKPGLVCSNCGCFIHLNCLQSQTTPGNFADDVFFNFCCEKCAPNQSEVLTRKKFIFTWYYSARADWASWLMKTWHLCESPAEGDNIDYLIGFLESVYGIGKVLEVFTNYDKNNKCVDYIKEDDYGNLDAAGWDYQYCTEMVMPMCTTGIDDMFEPNPWNYTSYAEQCHKKYGVYPHPDAAKILYGGDRLQAASNIVFSNGLLDPWAGGGILSSIGQDITAVVIIGAAHHLDLMPANDADRMPVREARKIHKQKISQWIADDRAEQRKGINGYGK